MTTESGSDSESKDKEQDQEESPAQEGAAETQPQDQQQQPQQQQPQQQPSEEQQTALEQFSAVAAHSTPVRKEQVRQPRCSHSLHTTGWALLLGNNQPGTLGVQMCTQVRVEGCLVQCCRSRLVGLSCLEKYSSHAECFLNSRQVFLPPVLK